MPDQGGQAYLEYVLLMVLILLVFFWAVQSNGPIQTGFQAVFNDTKTALQNMVDTAISKF